MTKKNLKEVILGTPKKTRGHPKKKMGFVSPVYPRSSVQEYESPFLHKIATKIVVDDSTFIPQYQSSGAACVDLIANLGTENPLIIPPNATEVIDCGFSLELPSGYKAVISARSGLASKGVIITNAPGIVDSDYRGRVRAIVSNIGTTDIEIFHCQRFAQMSIEPVYVFDWILSSTLEDTAREDGGFGSTGE
jgi:dUTP pyrophosphatase